VPESVSGFTKYDKPGAMEGDTMVELSAETMVWLTVVLFKKVMDDPAAMFNILGEKELS
jgi:hypothetical protein